MYLNNDIPEQFDREAKCPITQWCNRRLHTL